MKVLVIFVMEKVNCCCVILVRVLFIFNASVCDNFQHRMSNGIVLIVISNQSKHHQKQK